MYSLQHLILKTITMKKLTILTVLLGITLQGFSQSGIYGIRGGATLSSLNFDEAPGVENDTRNSFYIGFFADFRLNNVMAFVPEIQFSPEGAKNEALQLDFVQIPLFFKFKVHEKLRLGIGPQAAWNTTNTTPVIEDFQFSGLAGIEYKINQMFFVDLRYSYGVTDVFKDEALVQATNTNFQLGIGYQF